MRKEMLITVAGMALLAGTADVRAACIPTEDCASLGYKYTAAQCPDGGIACPLNVGTSSCVRNGTTYYASCGSSKCSSNQTCNNGTCYTPVAKSGDCCGYTTYCEYSGGTSNSYDHNCRKYYSGKSCYEQCKSNGYPDCTDMHASCRASGGTPVFQDCDGSFDYGYGYRTNFACQ